MEYSDPDYQIKKIKGHPGYAINTDGDIYELKTTVINADDGREFWTPLRLVEVKDGVVYLNRKRGGPKLFEISLLVEKTFG